MRTIQFYFRGMRNQKGTVLIFVAIAILCLLAFVALAINTGYVMVTRNELQNVSDASALAATRQLGVIYEPMTYQQQQSFVLSGNNLNAVRNAALNVANSNRAGQQNITLNDADIIIGQWNAFTKSLTPTPNQPDAVRVISRRDTSGPEGPISTFFSGIINDDTANVNAISTAALTGESTAWPGGLPLPFGISERWFQDPNFCGQHIRLYPTCPHEPCDATTQGCGGWTTYTDGFFSNQPPNANKLQDILINLRTGLQSPYTQAGETMYEFTGGTLSSAFPYMKQLFDDMRVRNDGIYDSDNDSNTWTTKVTIYNSNTCANPNQDQEIIGFATVVITQVLEAPEHIIDGRVLCDNVEPGRGGGGEYGTLGSIPGLVQ